MQLEPLPDGLQPKYDEVLRRLAPGPGNWVTFNDLSHLQSAYSFPLEFPDLRWVADAAKLRVIEHFARDCHKKAKELEECQLRHFRRPFGHWHKQAYFVILSHLETKLAGKGISRQEVRKLSESAHVSFQAAAERMIKRRFADVYYEESRLRQKMLRWKLPGVPGILERRALRNFKMLHEWCQPRVMAAYFRALFNGWATSRRMRTLTPQRGILECMLCHANEDSLEHYSLCNVFWAFACKPRPRGLGLSPTLRSRSSFFLLEEGMQVDDRVRMALGLYSLFRTVICCASDSSQNPEILLRLWTKRAAEGSRAYALLSP
jgi:hypothetical protein